jgi:hypothetical protein
MNVNTSEERIEKRKNARVFFTLEEDVNAVVSAHGDTTQAIPVTLLSIAPGGFSFMGNRYKLPEMNEGDRLILSDVETPGPLGPIERLEGVVKYILDFQHNVRLSIGCEFLRNPELPVQKIEEYIQYRLKNFKMAPSMESH